MKIANNFNKDAVKTHKQFMILWQKHIASSKRYIANVIKEKRHRNLPVAKDLTSGADGFNLF